MIWDQVCLGIGRLHIMQCMKLQEKRQYQKSKKTDHVVSTRITRQNLTKFILDFHPELSNDIITNVDKLRKSETKRNDKTALPFPDQNKVHVYEFQSGANLYCLNQKMEHYILSIQ